MKARLHIENPLLGRLNAVAVLVAWACLASTVLLLGYIKFASVPDRRAVVAVVVVLAAFLACLVVHAVLTFWFDALAAANISQARVSRSQDTATGRRQWLGGLAVR
jgi:hypothetical protein